MSHAHSVISVRIEQGGNTLFDTQLPEPVGSWSWDVPAAGLRMSVAPLASPFTAASPGHRAVARSRVTGPEPQHQEIYRRVSNNPGIRARDIAQAMGIDTQRVSEKLHELKKRRLVDNGNARNQWSATGNEPEWEAEL